MSRETNSTLLWRMLEQGAPLGHGTREITVDGLLCGRLAREMGAPPEQMYLALYNLPVRFVFAHYQWALKVEPGNPARALVNAAAKRKAA